MAVFKLDLPLLIAQVLTAFLVLGLLSFFVKLFKRDSRVDKLTKNIPGPSGVPLLGNGLSMTVRNEKFLEVFVNWHKEFGKIFKIWLLNKSFVIISDPNIVEKILSSSVNIEKGDAYEPLLPWLGFGLLTSGGKQWFTRRKQLTPTFHFKILDDFMEVFNEQANVLVGILSEDFENGKVRNVFPYVTRCALDIICETAMGKKLGAQYEHDQEYVKAIYEISEILLQRVFRPWLRPEFIWRLSSQGRREKKLLKILHGFTETVIRQRREEWKQAQVSDPVKQSSSSIARKKRLAFLDLLLDISEDGKVLSDLHIRQETDTFMFEGHDTTAANFAWTLLCLGANLECQKQVQEELDGIFGAERDKELTMADLSQMKYLECCIKESLRIFPSVPLFARFLVEDVVLESGITIPAKSTATIMPYLLHRDVDTFPEPEEFRPERFSAENERFKSPYSYIPFSAGPRNCIGQKFAMMEEKVVLSKILVNFNLEAVDQVKDVKRVADLILRPQDGILMKLNKRD